MKKSIYFIIISLFALISSCETDFDVNSDWEDISIVYGILNTNDTIHYIKINKTFLGDASAYEMSQISDSINYDDITSVTLERGKTFSSGTWDPKPQTSKIELFKTTDIEKDTGAFANDNNIIYYTDKNLPIDDTYNEYRLEIDIPGKDLVTASTELLNSLYIIKPNNFGKINFANYLTSTAAWNSIPNARIYELTIRFYYYLESTTSTDTTYTLKYLDWVQPSRTSNNANGGEEMQIEINGEAFFDFVASRLEPLKDGDRRIARRKKALDYIFLVGGEDLYTYIQVSSPSNTIVQEKPSYTNISNGLGIFSCRFDKTLYEIEIYEKVIDSLAYSNYTRHLNFVSKGYVFYSNNPDE